MDKQGVVIVRSQEEKDCLQRALQRASRMYNLYSQKECEGDCLEFPQYAAIFHSIPEDCATVFWRTGEVQ